MKARKYVGADACIRPRVDSSIDPYRTAAAPKPSPLGEGGRGPDEGQVPDNDPLTGNEDELCPHQPPAGGSFSLRAKSRLRRLRSDTRLRAQPLGRSLCRGGACPARNLPIKAIYKVGEGFIPPVHSLTAANAPGGINASPTNTRSIVEILIEEYHYVRHSLCP